MSLTVLSDSQIEGILETLTVSELEHFRQVLANALHDYSTNSQAVLDGTYHQPHRVSTFSPSTEATTLYMPSSGPGGMGVKIVTSSTPRDGIAKTSTESPQSSLDDESNPLSPPSTPPAFSPPHIQPTGALTLLHPDGRPLGFLHARTLTAFRTALSSACLLAKRTNVRTLTVFGSGLQAYWHVRLALKLRGATIKDVFIINRSFSAGARAMLNTFYAVPTDVRLREGWDTTRFSLLTPGYNDYGRLLEEHVRAADVVFCCTPSKKDLFEAEVLTSREARRKGRLVVAVGSHTEDMRELPEGLLRRAVREPNGHRHFHRHASEGGVIVVDTLDGALKEAGELVSAGLSPHQLVELGELVLLHRLEREESETSELPSPASTSRDDEDTPETPSSVASSRSLSQSDNSVESPTTPSSPPPPQSLASPSPSVKTAHSHRHLLPFRRRRQTSQSSIENSGKREEASAMVRWLRDGNVIYKSVGFGLMDLVTGMHLVSLAMEKGVGNTIEGFN